MNNTDIAAHMALVEQAQVIAARRVSGKSTLNEVIKARAAVEASARQLAAPERTEQAAPNRCPTGDLESAAVEMYERHGGKDWMREPDTETWRAVANIGFKWAALSHPRRHPLDVEALHELQKVMADFGGDWPDVPGEQEVVRRAKMLSRLWKTDAAGNWQQYAKEGETAQDVIERERKDSDALCTLLARAREKQQAAPGFVMVPVEVVKFLTGEGPLDGLWFGEHPFGLGGGKYWWRKHLFAARPLTASPTAPSTEASVVEPVGDGTLCGHCDGSGTVLAVTGHLGPDDYEYEAQCEACWGAGSSDLRDAINALSYQPHSVTPGRQMVHRADVLRIIAARVTKDQP